jgi:hypothetical protein
MYKIRVDLAQRDWSILYNSFLAELNVKYVEAYRFALELYGKSSNAIEFLKSLEEKETSAFTKYLIKDAVLTTTSSRLVKPKHTYFKVPGTRTKSIVYDCENNNKLYFLLNSSYENATLEIEVKDLDHELFKLFKLHLSNVEWPKVIKTNVKYRGYVLWNDIDKTIIERHGTNPYEIQERKTHSEQILSTYISKESHTQEVILSQDKYLF